METEDWATSSGGTSDSEVSTSGDLPKLQFRKDISKARWKEELGMAEIVGNRGQTWTTTGIVCSGKIYCSVEETLFLKEIGALHLLDDDDRYLPLEDIYTKVAEGKGGCSWESFEVYRHLKSLGYIVKRHGVSWSMKSVKSKSTSVEGTPGIKEITDKGYEDNSFITELFNNMQISEVRPVFDVYPPNSKFRKSNPGNPMFTLCLSSSNPPSKQQIENLQGQCNGIPVKFCHVEHGRVSFFSFNRVELPILPRLSCIPLWIGEFYIHGRNLQLQGLPMNFIFTLHLSSNLSQFILDFY